VLISGYGNRRKMFRITFKDGKGKITEKWMPDSAWDKVHDRLIELGMITPDLEFSRKWQELLARDRARREPKKVKR